ncbi:MAG: hypothetical protein NUV75_00620 [Gallionella sp.]|nr:hypothetical protein [Gallionella sp.]
MIYGIATWLAIAAFMAFGPPIRRGASHSSNHFFMVSLPDNAVLAATGQSPAGVKGQEVGEFRLTWLCGLIVAAPALMIGGPLGALAVVIAATAGNGISRALTGSFDYVGHGIEIIIAEREGREGYREAEIRRMIDWDRTRTGMSTADVDANLRKWHWLARIVERIV